MALLPDGLIAAVQAIPRRDVTDPAVQAHSIIPVRKLRYHTASILQAEQRQGTDALPLEDSTPSISSFPPPSTRAIIP